MKDYIIQKDDIKTFMWSDSSKKFGVNLIPQKGSAIRAPLFLLFYLLKNLKRPHGYIVRYLNDYRSVLRTSIRCISELFLILLCKIFKINLFWICHNVDKESETYYPLLSNNRRSLFASFSKKIFVTDQLLIGKAKEIFPEFQSKIDFVTFGSIINVHKFTKSKIEQETLNLIRIKKEISQKKGYQYKVLFCAGMPKSEKSLHFDFLLELLEKAKIHGIYIYALVSGDFKDSYRGINLLKQFRGNDQIHLFEDYTYFSHSFIEDAVDFYWRGYSDFSVPYSIYEAATVKKPVLALRSEFFSKFVEHYKLGLSIDLNSNDYYDVFKKIDREDFFYDNFLKSHDWKVIAEKLTLGV